MNVVRPARARLAQRARNAVAAVATPAAVTLVVAVLEAGVKWR